VQKVMEEANIKLSSVLSDVFGVSGQLMLEKLLERVGSGGKKGLLFKRTLPENVRQKRPQTSAHRHCPCPPIGQAGSGGPFAPA